MEIILFILLSAFFISAAQVSYNITQFKSSDHKSYRMTPKNIDQVIFLHYIRESDFGVAFSNRIGKMGDSVDFLSRPSLIQDINQQFSDLKLDITDIYSDVTIAFDNMMKNDKLIKSCEGSFGKTAASTVKLMPVSKIRGTELYTGIFYKLGLKRFPEGWVSWTNEVNGDNSHFVQIDLDPVNFPQYATGKTLEYNNQWLFGETEIPGYYTLMNRGIPRGLATWSSARKGTGNSLIISTNPEIVTRLSKGGNMRNDAMWAPKASNLENYYGLSIKQIPRGIVTWTYEKYRNISYYIIATTKEEDFIHYQPQGKWYDDSLFKFEPAELTLEGRVFNFQFKDGTLQDTLKNNSAPRQEASVIEIDQSNENNYDETFTLDETTSRDNTFTFEFKEPRMKIIPNTKIQVSLPMSAECVQFSFQQSSSGIKQRPKATQTQTTKVLAQIKMPKFTMLSASINSEWVDNLKLPFTAKMEISATAGRIMADGSGRGSPGPVPSAIFQQLLKSSAKTDMKIVDNSVNALTIEITGILTATFGTQTIVKCSSCHVDFIVLQQSSLIAS